MFVPVKGGVMPGCPCCDDRLVYAPGPCGCGAAYCLGCLGCGAHCRCGPGRRLVDGDEAGDEPDGPAEPVVVPAEAGP